MIETTCTTNSTSGIYPPAELTVEKLLDIRRTLTVDIPEIRETHHAVRRVQARVYAKRRAKSLAHHERMNKKWRKRFGETVTPAAFEMDVELAWGGRSKKILFIHPDLMRMVREQFSCAVDRQINDVFGGIMCSALGKRDQ